MTLPKTLHVMSFGCQMSAADGEELSGPLLRRGLTLVDDPRLGANEAPPAIMSVYLGAFLDKLLGQIEKGAGESEAARAALETGLKRLPALTLDNSDRNRTSPIAFTGNKFETM